MYCSKCGAQLPDDATFCFNCGQSQSAATQQAYQPQIRQNQYQQPSNALEQPNGRVRTVRIDMGAPILEGREVPVNFDGRFINQPFEIEGVKFRANAVSMGNPHFITFDDIGEDNVRRLGPVLEGYREFFPRKTNVEFCSVKDGKIYVTVYERGAAWTLACGTGACASTTAAALNGLVPFDTPVDVHLPGGWLKITVDKDLGYVLMEGPAEFVFEGNTD